MEAEVVLLLLTVPVLFVFHLFMVHMFNQICQVAD